MEHPFITSLSDKTIEELQIALSDLNSKLTFAYRTQNTALIHQLHMAIDSYRKEYSKKMDEMFKNQKISNQIKIER